MKDAQCVTASLWSPVLCHHPQLLEKWDCSKLNCELLQQKRGGKPLWTNSTYILQQSILSINISAILTAAEICVIHGYYVTFSVLHTTASEEMDLKSGWFKQNWTKSMVLYLLLICLPSFSIPTGIFSQFAKLPFPFYASCPLKDLC